MNQMENPRTVHQPLGTYHHTARIAAGSEWLVIAGQVGMNAKGHVATGAGRQTEQALKNIVACLRANLMDKEDLVKLTIYLTDAAHIEEMRAARRKVLGNRVQPPSTLLVIDALASPDFLVEVEAMAAKAPS